MFIYGVNFGIKNTMLLYPKYIENIDDNLELGKGENLINLKMRSLDLDFNGGYSGFIEEIRNRTKELI